MDFNINNCSTLYIGTQHRKRFTMNEVNIGESNSEKNRSVNESGPEAQRTVY